MGPLPLVAKGSCLTPCVDQSLAAGLLALAVVWLFRLHLAHFSSEAAAE